MSTKKLIFCWHLESHCQKDQDPDLLSKDPDQYQNVTDLELWNKDNRT
jgi:hypothetical protein